ncbi:hypothetical protein VE02_04627 [Pseudogymnoascus sp. 03VT05]|nr:hypothetical protein VE02_04627 [Pseudogymnoascus sp. 03VT05]
MATNNPQEDVDEELDEELDEDDDILSRAQKCEESRHTSGQRPQNTVGLQNEPRLQLSRPRKFPQAESVARDVVERRRRVLGDHADTASAMNSLSISIKAQERVEEGLLSTKRLWKCCSVLMETRRMLRSQRCRISKVVDFRVQKLGKNDRETIIAMDMLARDFTARGQWDRAQELQEEVTWLAQANFGDGDNTTICCILNLLKTYRHLGEPDKALKMMEDALSSFRLLGRDHTEPSASLMKQLAVAYTDQDRFEEAEPLLEEFYEWIKGLLGPDHPVTEDAGLDLTDNLVAQGKLVKTNAFGL